MSLGKGGRRGELDCIGLEFLWPNEQERSSRGISTQVKEICNGMVEYGGTYVRKSLLALYQDMNFSWGKTLYIECCTRKERNGLMWLLAEVWKLEELERKEVQ